MAIEARNRPLPQWLTRASTWQLTLPRFQRFEAWTHSNIAELFNTVLRDLPMGALLVLEVGDEEPFLSRQIVGAPSSRSERTAEQLLDGQQRITALWRGLNNNYEDRTYFLYLKDDEETGMPYFINSIARWKKVEKQSEKVYPLWANDPKQLWAERMIPLELCAPDASKQFREWARKAIENEVERDDATELVSEIRSKFNSYNIAFLALPVNTSKDTALDVFIKMNTSAQPLSTYDIVVAQFESEVDRSLHDLVEDAKRECPSIERYYPLDSLALYSNALMQGKAPANSTYLSKDFGKSLLGNWDKFTTGIVRTVAFLEEERIFDSARLPTDVVIPVLTALWAIAPNAGDAAGRTRTILRKYLWRSFFTNRYEKSTGSRSLVDHNQLKGILNNELSLTVIALDDELNPLPSAEELVRTRWPKNNDRLARAILAVALRRGGLDLADGSAVTRDNLKKREYHHIFPAAYLEKAGRKESEIFRSLNCALVSWQTNRTISDKKPERYLAERLDGTNLGEKEIRQRLESHLIPYDEMVKENYDEFLAKRSQLIHSAMQALCDGSTMI